MNTTKLLFTIAFLILTFSFSFAQEKQNSKKDKKTAASNPNSTQALGNTIEFKNETTNSILTITDEGNSAGSLELKDVGSVLSGPKLFNNGGDLYWNNKNLAKKEESIVIGAINFVPRDNVTAYQKMISQGGAYVTTATTSPLYAPINLPVGATITDMIVYYRDNYTGSNIHVQLKYEAINFGTFAGSNFNFYSTGANSSWQTSSTISSTVTISAFSSYFIIFSPEAGSWSGNYNTAIKGVKLFYTY